jgi:hypothetical protein
MERSGAVRASASICAWLALVGAARAPTVPLAPHEKRPASSAEAVPPDGAKPLQAAVPLKDIFDIRWTVTRNGLFGIVAFLNTQTLSDKQTGERLFDSLATGGGVGLRLLINKRSKTNLCLDFGLGREGSSGVYFGVQEAF